MKNMSVRRLGITAQPGSPTRASRQTGDARQDFVRVANGRVTKLCEAADNLANVCKTNRHLMTPDDWARIEATYQDILDDINRVREHGGRVRHLLGT